MAYIQPELVREAKKMDLLTYLERYNPSELVRINSRVYSTRSHDSLKISNGKWMWWSRGIGGRSALDYLIKVEGMQFVDAVKHIVNAEKIDAPPVHSTESQRDGFVLPDKNRDTDRVTAYLFGRGIDLEIIYYCMRKGYIYESLPYHNVVFVGFNDSGKAAYAAYRATKTRRIMGEAKGSRKDFSFRLEGTNEHTVHVFESAIDLLSYATLVKHHGGKWTENNYLSLGGVSCGGAEKGAERLPAALKHYIGCHRELKCVCLHFDNDRAGKFAADITARLLAGKYEVVNEPPQIGKDFNDELQAVLKIKCDEMRKEKDTHAR